MKEPQCPYCQRAAHLVKGNVIYPHRPDLSHLNFWNCPPCKAYVGCHRKGKHHKNDSTPLGRLANAELRQMKSKAHAAFDPKWKHGGFTRKEAYRYLADRLGIEVSACHIGDFDVDKCRLVIEICAENWRD